MYALIYKDFLLLKKQLLYVLVLAVFYTVIDAFVIKSNRLICLGFRQVR